VHSAASGSARTGIRGINMGNAWTSTQTGSWSTVSSDLASPWYDGVAGAQTLRNSIPQDGDGLITIAANHIVTFDADQSGWATGLAGVVITSHATTPGMLICSKTAATTNFMMLKTGTTIAGTNAATRGRLAANNEKTWAGTTALANSTKFIISLLGTSYVDATYLDLNLRCTEPTNKFVTTYGAGTLDTVVSIDIGTDIISTTANAPADTTAIRFYSTGTYPTGIDQFNLYYVRDSTGAGKTMKVALQSGGTAVDISGGYAGTLSFFQGYAAGSDTVACIENVTADAPWSTTDGLDYCVLCDFGPADYDHQRVGLVTINAASIQLSAAVDSVQYPGARLRLMARNIQIRSNGTTSTQTILSWGTSTFTGSIVNACLINTAGTGTTFYGYGTNAGVSHSIGGTISGCTSGVNTGSGHVISGTISGCTYGVNTGSGHTISSTISGCTYGVNTGSGHTISSTISGCTYGVYTGSGHAISGTISGCSYGTYSGSGHTISGTISGCSYGVSYGSGHTISGTISGCSSGVYYGSGYTISGATFTGNTYDLRIVVEGMLYNTLLQATVENYQYNSNNVPSWSYVESFNHDQVSNTFKSWTRGGVTVSDTTPANLPIGYAVVYKHICEDATMQNFRQIRAFILPGATLKVNGQIRIADDHTAWAPRLEIIAVSADPLWGLGGAVLATSSVAEPNGGINPNFQTVTASYTNATVRIMKVQIRVSAKRAAGDMYENWSSAADPSAAGLTSNAITTTVPGRYGATVRWHVNGSTTDASSCEELRAAPGIGYQLVIERLFISIGGPVAVTLGEDELAGDVASVLLGPLGGAPGTYELDFREQPIVMTANKALTIDANGAGIVDVYVEGYTRAA
jgi:hypothetical protein